MSKNKKLFIMFALSILSTLVVPIFAKWYQAKTGIYPLPFIFVLLIGGLVSLVAIATDNFKDLE